MSDESDILFSRTGGVGHVKLNRPHTLNALNYDMVIAMQQALDDWAMDSDVAVVLVQGVGARAFCASGDIRRLA